MPPTDDKYEDLADSFLLYAEAMEEAGLDLRAFDYRACATMLRRVHRNIDRPEEKAVILELFKGGKG